MFSGPFDLLLGLIAKHQLDVTEIALAQVTDEFVGWIRARGSDWRLEEASEFLVVAATLLDLKAARLLPVADVEDEQDLALLEARDLLFARLLQYRAFKQVAAVLAERMATESLRVPRAVPVEPRFAQLLPELVLGITPDQLAGIAAAAMVPRQPQAVGTEHLHAPVVSVQEQAALLVDRLRRGGGQLPRTRGGRGRDQRGGGPLPRAAGAVPGRRGRLRPGHPARRADRALDGHGQRRGRRPGRVRRAAAAGG